MDDFYSRQKVYWDRLSNLDPDVSIIDPADRRGLKNAYLAAMRDSALRSKLSNAVRPNGLVLDFGCGTGSASLTLLRSGYRVIGVDLSINLLRQAAQRCGNDNCVFVAIDGKSIPMQAESLDGAITYGVICYVPDDNEATNLICRIREIMRPGSILLMIEQCRRKRLLSEDGLKVQRTIPEWSALIESAGFSHPQTEILRHGRFPTTPMIRYGLIPRSLWCLVERLEANVAARTGIWPWDYADVLFSARN